MDGEEEQEGVVAGLGVARLQAFSKSNDREGFYHHSLDHLN
jgi:hypothetical protein